MNATGMARLERARAARPKDPAVARSLGIAYYKAGRFADARKQLEEAMRLDPRDGSATLYLGLTAERQGDLAGAKTAYQSYIRHGRTSKLRRQLETRLAAITRQELQASAKTAVASEQRLIGQQGSPRTIAVMPLRFVGRDTTLQPLERGIAELITIDLSRSHLLTVVERARLQALLDEMALQQSGQTDSTTRVRAGRIIQAGRIVSGQIAQNANRLRIDAAILNTQTAGLAGGAASENTLEQVFNMEKTLVLQLFDSLRVPLTTAERTAIEQRPTRSLQAFLAYSRGLRLEDQGRYEEASRTFGIAAQIDPGFLQAKVKSSETQAAALGVAATPAAVESNMSGTTEGTITNQSVQGEAPPSNGSSENSAGSTANALNPSSSGSATGDAGVGTSAPPPKDPLASATGNEGALRSAIITIILRLPTGQ
jgi:tetratricopeptide (TPR) repeat protein